MSKPTDLDIDGVDAVDEDGLGKRIEIARNAAGLLQKELAAKIGKSRATIVQYEAGNIWPPIKIIRAIAQVLGVGPAHLAFGVSSERDLPPGGKRVAVPMGNRDNGEIGGRDGLKMPQQLVADLGWPAEGLRLLRLDLAAPHFSLGRGDMLIVDCDNAKFSPDGKIYAISYVGGVMVVRCEALPEDDNNLPLLTGPNGQTFWPSGISSPLGRVVGRIHSLT